MASSRQCVFHRSGSNVVLPYAHHPCVCGQVEAQIQELSRYQATLAERKAKLLRQIGAEQRAPKADWLRGTFAWDAEVLSVLRSMFGLTSFRSAGAAPCHATPAVRQHIHPAHSRRPSAMAPCSPFAFLTRQPGASYQLLAAPCRPLQREVVNATLQGRDVLCLLPSGGGK